MSDLSPYLCPVCGDRFGAHVWHCRTCDHHYHVADDECGNCHVSRRKNGPGAGSKLRPRTPEQIEDDLARYERGEVLAQ